MNDFLCHYNINNDYSNIYIMHKNGIGFVRISWYNNDNCGFISDLSVDISNRNKGIGNKIIKYAEEIIYNNHKEFSQLKVLENSWMVKWYRKLNYLPLTSENNYLWMIKKLENNE